jgi:hypothetical protein
MSKLSNTLQGSFPVPFHPFRIPRLDYLPSPSPDHPGSQGDHLEDHLLDQQRRLMGLQGRLHSYLAAVEELGSALRQVRDQLQGHRANLERLHVRLSDLQEPGE